MKKSVALTTVVLLFVITNTSAGGQRDNLRNDLVGAWRLAWLEEPGADGKIHKADCTGLLVYTADGHMSVQVMYRNPQTPQAGPVQYAAGGYEASYGTYEINDSH